MGKFESMEASYHEEPEQPLGKVTVTNGCYIDSAVPYSQSEIISKLVDLLECWNPYHDKLKEKYSVNAINEFSNEIIEELTTAINESIDDSQCASWIGGDLIILDCEE